MGLPAQTGHAIAIDDVDQSGYAEANPFRFSTKWLDEELAAESQTGAIGETGLYYYGMRYYSPTLGRWINEDPIEERGGLNLYAFVGNEPIGRVDALGFAKIDFDHSETRRAKPERNPYHPGDWRTGATTLKRAEFSVALQWLVPIPDGWAITLKGKVEVEWWWTERPVLKSDYTYSHTISSRDHEMTHVDIWEKALRCDLKKDVAEYEAATYCPKKKASCYAQVLLLYKNYRLLYGKARNRWFDCEEYQDGPAKEDVCASAREYDSAANDARNAIQAQLSTCKTVPGAAYGLE